MKEVKIEYLEGTDLARVIIGADITGWTNWLEALNNYNQAKKIWG